jgi:hypothetical protein
VAHPWEPHVLLLHGRPRDGIAWMRDNIENWSGDSFLKIHNWWHLALYHYELGEADEVLSLYDGPIYGERSTLALNMLDASAILWRLHLGGVDVGGRWQVLADNWQAAKPGGHYAFNDMHAAMAYVGSGRWDAIEALLEVQKEAMGKRGDNASFTRDVGHPATLAVAAFGRCVHFNVAVRVGLLLQLVLANHAVFGYDRVFFAVLHRLWLRNLI